jgi:SAM-dependent methyltransferases related to tRNA (uracil-5-)-methyltransferase
MRVGFYEKKSGNIADMKTCEVLPPHVSAMLMPLRFMIRKLSIYDRMPQIELAVGSSVTALVLRNLAPLTAADEQVLRDFADEHKVQWWLQPGAALRRFRRSIRSTCNSTTRCRNSTSGCRSSRPISPR